MRATPSPFDDNEIRLAGRQAWVNSAGLTAALAMALLSRARSQATGRTPRGASGQQSHKPAPALRNKAPGFMLAREQSPVAKLVEFGFAAEQAGIALLTTSDLLQPWQTNEGHSNAAWATMGALSQRTSRVWMKTTVTCSAVCNNPAVVTVACAPLGSLAPGRIYLGLGTGEALNEQASTGSWPKWPKWPERSAPLIEATAIIRQLWRGRQIAHEGASYKVIARLCDPPAKTIPMLMAANGPKAMHRAGQYADGLITDPKTWKEHKSEFEAGAKVAGKDAAKMPVLGEQHAVVGDKGDAQRSAELGRFAPKAFRSYYNIRDPKEIQRRVNCEVPMEKVYADWPVSTGTAVHATSYRGAIVADLTGPSHGTENPGADGSNPGKFSLYGVPPCRKTSRPSPNGYESAICRVTRRGVDGRTMSRTIDGRCGKRGVRSREPSSPTSRSM
jgi:F420-dependent hydroxymycolic acid dehydrogenase